MVDLAIRKQKESRYQRPEIDRGYAGQYLSMDLARMEIKIEPVPAEIKTVFVGGKGFDLWLLWNSVSKGTKWNDAENAICIASGPMGGTPMYPGSGKSIVTTISPLTDMVIDSNVGGYFGPYLKFSGFDALKIAGKAEEETVIYIDGVDQILQVLNVQGLPDDAYGTSEMLTEHFSRGKKGNISVVSSGPGAGHTLMGCVNFSWYDSGRKKVRYKQAGRGGVGTVFVDKGLKAIVARWEKVTAETNNPADPELLKNVAKSYSREIRELDPKQNEMSTVGTTHLVPIMNDFDLLPVHNFRFGSHPGANLLGSAAYRNIFDPGFDGCWKGCSVACSHGIRDFIPMTGPYRGKKVFVDGPEYETIAGCGSNLGIFDPYAVAEMNFYCDAYGIDTISFATATAFAMECFETGQIKEAQTGGLELRFGNRVAALELLHQMAAGEGFGAVVGQGVRKMKRTFSEQYGADADFMRDIGMETKGLEFSEYITKESLAQQGGYGMALKGPQHDEAWLIFLDMVHNLMPTFEQKAEALHWFPMMRTWFGLCGLCKLPWNDIVPEDNKNTPEPAKVIQHVQWYADYFASVTGVKATPESLIQMSERVYNFQRIFNLKMGFGRREHDGIPYRAVGPVTVEEYESRKERYDKQLTEIHGVDISGKETEEKIVILRKIREDGYRKLQDAVYKRRGWNADGIPTLETARHLGIDFPDVVEVLRKNGVAA